MYQVKSFHRPNSITRVCLFNFIEISHLRSAKWILVKTLFAHFPINIKNTRIYLAFPLRLKESVWVLWWWFGWWTLDYSLNKLWVGDMAMRWCWFKSWKSMLTRAIRDSKDNKKSSRYYIWLLFRFVSSTFVLKRLLLGSKFIWDDSSLKKWCGSLWMSWW